MIIKLDFEKTYDKLEWNFIQETLLDGGVPHKLSDIITNCISYCVYRLLWNGEGTDPIHSSKGLKQGDLLSSYLFVLCMERFVHWIGSKKLTKEWRPIKASR